MASCLSKRQEILTGLEPVPNHIKNLLKIFLFSLFNRYLQVCLIFRLCYFIFDPTIIRHNSGKIKDSECATSLFLG